LVIPYCKSLYDILKYRVRERLTWTIAVLISKSSHVWTQLLLFLPQQLMFLGLSIFIILLFPFRGHPLTFCNDFLSFILHKMRRRKNLCRWLFGISRRFHNWGISSMFDISLSNNMGDTRSEYMTKVRVSWFEPYRGWFMWVGLGLDKRLFRL